MDNQMDMADDDNHRLTAGFVEKYFAMWKNMGNSQRYKGSCHFRFSGIRPLRGGGVPPFSAKEKNLLFFTLIFR